jgi:hypothetical protein
MQDSGNNLLQRAQSIRPWHKRVAKAEAGLPRRRRAARRFILPGSAILTNQWTPANSDSLIKNSWSFLMWVFSSAMICARFSRVSLSSINALSVS